MRRKPAAKKYWLIDTSGRMFHYQNGWNYTHATYFATMENAERIINKYPTLAITIKSGYKN